MLLAIKAYVRVFDPNKEEEVDLGIKRSEEEMELYLRNMMVRTEDVYSIYENPNNKKQSIMLFYEGFIETIIVNESFESLLERFLDLEIDTYYTPEQLKDIEENYEKEQMKNKKEIENNTEIKEDLSNENTN